MQSKLSLTILVALIMMVFEVAAAANSKRKAPPIKHKPKPPPLTTAKDAAKTCQEAVAEFDAGNSNRIAKKLLRGGSSPSSVRIGGGVLVGGYRPQCNPSNTDLYSVEQIWASTGQSRCVDPLTNEALTDWVRPVSLAARPDCVALAANKNHARKQILNKSKKSKKSVAVM